MWQLLLLLLCVPTSLSEKSFTLVVDTTVSMRDEIYVLKANIGHMLNSMVNTTNYDNFVLVPFKDTAIEPPYKTTSVREFTSRLNSITTSGGYDCPENSLAGIEAALRASEIESSIFVFTDAYAKDYNSFRTVETLCKETHSQVLIFLSGYCSTPVGNVEVYYDVAKACAGAVFTCRTAVELREAFKFMKEIVNTDWSNVTHYKAITEFKEIWFSADSFTTDYMFVISGPVLNLQVILNSQTITMETIVETTKSKVVRLRNPEVGDYKAILRSTGPVSITFYERNNVPFQFGFSTRTPRSMKETSRWPLAGSTNYIIISVDNSIKLRSVEWLNLGDSVKQNLLLTQLPSGFYITSVYVEQGKTFRFWIIGEETYTRHEIKGSSKVISPQRSVNENQIKRSLPEAEILDSQLGLINFDTELTLACKVIGYPQPEIRWNIGDNTIRFTEEIVLLEIPSVYISYLTVSKVQKNFTAVCNSENDEGSTYKGIDIYVNRTFSFEVIERPEDASVEYGTEHRLHCHVEAYPDASVQWYLNNSQINTLPDSRVYFENNALVIKNMDFEDVGAYECRATNNVRWEKLVASISISGIEAPIIDESETDINLKPGDQTEIECRISKGKPAPEIIWKYKALQTEEFKYVPDGVSANDGKLKIAAIERSQAGVYRCIATNVIGENTRDFNVQIQSPPIVKDSEREDIEVKEGDEVYLSCDVEATPEATVRWEMSKDDVSITLDKRFRAVERHALRFTAFWNDSGNYHCVAENSVGTAERTVFVNVLVKPFIQSKSGLVFGNVGGSVTLACNVQFGNPTPTIRWQFIAKNSASSALRGNNSGSSLQLTQLSQRDEGSYICIAENRLSTDRIIYQLEVQQ